MAARDDLLARAERHVEQGRQRIERQRIVIERLKLAGHDVKTEEEVLGLFERLQVKFEADLDRLVQHKKQLAVDQVRLKPTN